MSLEARLTEGITTGEHKNKLETARKLIELNSISVEQIVYVTGLSVEELKKL